MFMRAASGISDRIGAKAPCVCLSASHSLGTSPRGGGVGEVV